MHHRPASAAHEGGFTLIELMIAVAVISILAAIGYPSYVDYIRRGQLPEAFSALADYRIKMEQYFLDHRNYGTAAPCAEATTASVWNDFKPAGAKYFKYSCVSSGTGFLVTAEGIEGRAIGHAYTVDERGRRRTTQFKGNAVDKACWIVRGSEC